MSKRFFWVFLIPAVALTAVLLAAGGAAGGGQEEETAGNNLSLPVIWGESAQLPLRGTHGSTQFDGAYTEITIYYDENGEPYPEPLVVPYYEQKDPLNVWQAENHSYFSTLPVTWIDWGDNLESQDWKTTSKVRVETVLYKDLGVLDSLPQTWPLMLGYEMAYLSGAGTTEVWGTNGKTYGSDQATIYSDHARLTIQRIDPLKKDSLLWDEASGEWYDPDLNDGNAVLSTDFNGGCWQSVDGPGGYSAEVNVSGKAIYGYNWDVRATSNEEQGLYRITFSLDGITAENGSDSSHPLGQIFTTIDGSTQIKPITVEGETTDLLAKGTGGGKGGGKGGKAGGGGEAVIDPEHNLTYIDVTIKAGGGGRH
jgi:hypothetical protein